MDLPTQAAAVRRSVAAGERDGRPTRAVVASQEYQSGIDDVWDAVTNPERLPRWFLPVTGELSVGGRYQFEGNAGGEVLACEKPESAYLTWEFGGEVSWLEVRLTDLGGRTRLELEHIAHVEPERWGQFGPGAVGVGWDLSFLGLANHLAGGPDVQPEADVELLGTPAGREFIAASSAAWAAASIIAGEDPAAARAAEERTTAFYTATE
jgi:uncharacterized protein YndB with AHSA1/START domain